MSFSVLNLKYLGGGGFADVYLGTRSDTGEQVVVKYLREPQIPGAKKAFMREWKILSRNLHRKLMNVLGANLEAEKPFYVMPYVEGGSLVKWAGRLDDRQILDFALQLADVISALHDANVVHGDIKPDNTLVSGSDIRLGDPLGNGSGCTISFGTKLGGTPGYWAPEIAAGNPISKAGDCYSYGATLYHLATGLVPVDGRSLDPLPYRPSSQGNGLRDVILAACRLDPSQRPTMADIRAYLMKSLLAQPKQKSAVPAQNARLVAAKIPKPPVPRNWHAQNPQPAPVFKFEPAYKPKPVQQVAPAFVAKPDKEDSPWGTILVLGGLALLGMAIANSKGKG
ncbi:serine/threonine-protein kinase [Archangium sp. Cb G35]|uniref:serine/threonine-protein kinase n=1 Tax=Archangium sp. Cb G35 TaxID=1920190 RepID=UPI000937B1CA|nr:serine/threonine-protein kinase [Archangium sp. Cb G35]